MTINIRPVTLADMPAIHALVHELAIYERAPEAHTATIQDYENDYNAGIFDAKVAENTEGVIVGMVLYHLAYSTWKGRMMYLEDFVVTESYRQFGVGQILFDAFLQAAKEQDCRLVKWQVLDWNTPAIRFYEKNKAIIETEWHNGKIFLS